MAVLYADSSALVKLVRDEAESAALHRFVEGADLASCGLVLTELPRALRRVAAGRTLQVLLSCATALLDAIAFVPLEDALLVGAGALDEPRLRTLDAIHIAAALSLWPLDGFVSYDERQSAAGRLAGLRTVAPGA